MKVFTVFFLLVLCSITYSQTIAITEKGDTVLLYKDGNWEFKTSSSEISIEQQSVPDTNSTLFVKDDLAQKVLKGQKVDYQLWFDSNKWELTDLKSSSGEYTLAYKDGTAYCMIIPENISLTIEGLKNIAITNAKSAAKKIEVVDEDIRNVNGKYVYMMEFKGDMQGIKFIYFGYYYADDNVSIQLLTYTYQNLFDEYKEDLEKMLNGLVLPNSKNDEGQKEEE